MSLYSRPFGLQDVTAPLGVVKSGYVRQPPHEPVPLGITYTDLAKGRIIGGHVCLDDMNVIPDTLRAVVVLVNLYTEVAKLTRVALLYHIFVRWLHLTC